MEARQILCNLPETDPAFFAELTQPQSRVSASTFTPEEAILEDMEVSKLNNPGDNSIVSLKTVTNRLEGDIYDNGYIPDNEWGLVSAAETEKTLVDKVNGIRVDRTKAVKKLEKCG